MHWYETKLVAGAIGSVVVYLAVLMVGGRGRLTCVACAVRLAVYVFVGAVTVHYTSQSTSSSDHFLMGLMWPYLIFGFIRTGRMAAIGPHDRDVALAEALGMP